MIDDTPSTHKGWPYVDMPEKGDKPKSAMLCVLEVTHRDNRLGFEYSSISRFELEGKTIDQAVTLARSNRIKVDHRPLEASGHRPSRLSLANDGFDYIVFVLGESMANIEFSKDRAFSGVDASGTVFHKPTRMNARIAWFTSNNTRPGVHWFNIHLDVLDDEGFGPIPIIIDPDIGHPGGTGGRL